MPARLSSLDRPSREPLAPPPFVLSSFLVSLFYSLHTFFVRITNAIRPLRRNTRRCCRRQRMLTDRLICLHYFAVAEQLSGCAVGRLRLQHDVVHRQNAF